MKDSEEKRLKSLAEKKQSYKQQKNAIQQALHQIESTSNNRKNRIVFNENDDLGEHDFEKNTFFIKPSKKRKVALFENENGNDDEEINFKEQFDGTKGQKLLELQSRYAHDSRFTMDSRFLEDDNHEKQEVPEEDSLENEKKKQLNILSSITGKKISEHSQKQVKGMKRFDPSKPDHSKFEIEVTKNEPELKKKKKDKQKITHEEETLELSKASQKTFYKVSNNLKDALQENNTFSLLNMFGDTPETVSNHVPNDETPMKSIKKKKHIGPVSNPFKYDSSDSEDEPHATKSNTKLPANKETNVINGKLSTEKFFFYPDDPRFKEGLDFILKVKDEVIPDSYSNTRREVKQLIRSKIRNNKRNQRPFQKKLGGRKIFKSKRK